LRTARSVQVFARGRKENSESGTKDSVDKTGKTAGERKKELQKKVGKDKIVKKTILRRKEAGGREEKRSNHWAWSRSDQGDSAKLSRTVLKNTESGPHSPGEKGGGS